MITKSFDPNSPLCNVTFSIRLPDSTKNVSVVGEFNGWTPAVHTMEKSAGGVFSKSLPLPAGQRFQFKYLCDKGHWHNDDAADSYQSDDHGCVNSVVITPPLPAVVPAPAARMAHDELPLVLKPSAKKAAPKKAAAKKTAPAPAPKKEAPPPAPKKVAATPPAKKAAPAPKKTAVTPPPAPKKAAGKAAGKKAK